MKKKQFHIELKYKDIVEIVKQLSKEDMLRLRSELKKYQSLKFNLDQDKIKTVLEGIDSHFVSKLGKYTHKKSSAEHHIHSLNFIRKDMRHLFGIHIGFFKKTSDTIFSHVGMAVKVQTSGSDTALREQILHFFRSHLQLWLNQPERDYTTLDTDERGIELGRLKAVREFKNTEQILDFLRGCIDGLYRIYPKITENPGGIFDNIVRDAPTWQDSILDMGKM